jgi:ERCC4-type nuclease
MTYHVVVDSRPGETALFHLVKPFVERDKAVLERRQLDIGDIWIETEKMFIVLERKTFRDLSASLTDGRYKNQKVRLLAEQERRAKSGSTQQFIFAYIIENATVPSWDGTTLMSKNLNSFAALVKMAIRDDIPSLWLATPKDVAMAVSYIGRTSVANGFDAGAKLQRDRAGGYATFVQHTGKRKNAENEQFAIMLTTVNGISAKKGTAIATVYGTMANLMAAYTALKAASGSDDALNNMLQDIEIADKRRLGNALSTRVRVALGV